MDEGFVCCLFDPAASRRCKLRRMFDFGPNSRNARKSAAEAKRIVLRSYGASTRDPSGTPPLKAGVGARSETQLGHKIQCLESETCGNREN